MLVKEQVRRLLQSELLRGSETQRRLFSYLAEQSLAGVADQLKEYTVGVEGLGKHESYDPRQDPSVRIQAGKLRRRLEEYYRTEGVNDPILIEFPKGRFKLTFSRLSPSPEAGAPAARRWRMISAGLAVALTVVSAAGIFLGTRRTGAAAESWTPDLEAIWSPMLSEQRPVLVCVGTPLFILFHGAGLFRDTSLNDWQAAEKSPTFMKLKEMFPQPPIRPQEVFTGMGEAGGAFEVAKLLGARTSDLLFARSSELSWEEIAKSNAVFLGPPKYVRHLKDIPMKQDFVVDSDADMIRNLHPRPGEPASFPDQPRGDAVTHALISRLPGLHGRGEIFVFASNLTGGTLGAVQYATEPAYARDMARRLRLPSGKLPRHYQIVVEVMLQNLYPVKISYKLHHVLAAN